MSFPYNRYFDIGPSYDVIRGRRAEPEREHGTLAAFCPGCFAEWEFDVELVADETWRAIDASERRNFDLCPDCETSLTFAPKVERHA